MSRSDRKTPAQIALPLEGAARQRAIVIGNANEAALQACQDAQNWPFRTAILSGPPRSGKSLIAQWFEASGLGTAIDDAESRDEADLFHAWNRAQESGRPLLLVARPVSEDAKDGLSIALPDLRSRLGSALGLVIGAPDDAMLGALIEAHAAQRGLILPEGAAGYLVPRLERSFAAVEALVAAIDRLSLERKAPPTLAIWREALEALSGEGGAGEQQELF